jgi:hypothetical protein
MPAGACCARGLSWSTANVLIRVDDRGAVYPLRVDPFIQQAELTASDGAENDRLGSSVAVAGNTVLAGAYLHMTTDLDRDPPQRKPALQFRLHRQFGRHLGLQLQLALGRALARLDARAA